MTIEVRVPPLIQKVTGGAKSLNASGGTINELLRNLDEHYPGFSREIRDESGKLHRFVNIYLNDEDVRVLNSLDTPLKDGDVVSILPAMAFFAVNAYQRLVVGEPHLGFSALSRWGYQVVLPWHALSASWASVARGDSIEALKATTESLLCKDTMAKYTTEKEPQLMSTVLHEAAHNLGPAHQYKANGKIEFPAFIKTPHA